MDASNSFSSVANSSEEDRLYTGWKDIQKTTFTNWANSVLACHSVVIHDLYTDLCDGTLLVKLYENISGSKIDKNIAQPRILSHKLENISLVMKAMSRDGIKFVNLDPLDICNGSEKLILALIWHMILYYQIGFLPPNRSDCAMETQTRPFKKTLPLETETPTYTVTPKALVLRLINALVPQMRAMNLTTAWNNGKALAALVETLSPGSCPSYETWNDRNSLLNVTTALCLAEVHLGIPVLIEPHHMASTNVDELSVITYLSSFFRDGGVAEKYFLNNLLERFPSLDVSNMTTDWNNGVALCKLVKICHFAVFPGGYYTDECMRDVSPEQKKSMSISNIKAALSEAQRLLKVAPNVDPELFASTNVPALVVMGYVSEFMFFQPVESPSTTSLSPNDIQLSLISDPEMLFPGETVKLMISGSKVLPSDVLTINISCDKAGKVNKTVKYRTEFRSDREQIVEFTPIDAATYKVEVLLNSAPVCGSPLKLSIQPQRIDMPDIVIEQLEKDTFLTGELINFIISSNKSVENLFCYLEEVGSKKRISCDSARLSNHSLRNSARLAKPGTYYLVVQTIYGNIERDLIKKTLICVPNTDELIKILPNNSLVVLVGEKIKFQVDTRAAGPGRLDIKVRPQLGQCCGDKGLGVVSINECNGVWDCTVYITSHQSFCWRADCYWNNQLLPEKFVLINTFNTENASVSGCGLNGAVQINTRQSLQVYVGECGKVSKVTGCLQKKGPSGQVLEAIPLEFFLRDRHLYETKYQLTTVGSYFLKICLNDKEIGAASRKIESLDVKRLDSEVVADSVNVGDKIDVRVIVPAAAGKGDLFYAMEGPEGPMKVFVEPVHRDEFVEIYLLSSVPNTPGEYKLILQFGGLDIPGFPKSFVAVDHLLIELKNTKIEFGLIKAAVLNVENHFSVLCAGKTDGPELHGYYTQGEGAGATRHSIKFTLEQAEVYRATYKVVRKEEITMRVFLGDSELHTSPFTLPVIDPSTIEVDFGQGASDGLLCGQRYLVTLFIPNEFQLTLTNTSPHTPLPQYNLKDCLNASIIPPNGRIFFPEILELTSEKDRLKSWLNSPGKVYQLGLSPIEEGKYILHFSFLTHPIVGFPKAFYAKRQSPKPALDKIKITLPSQEFKIGDLSSIFVDGREAGFGWLDVTLLDPDNLPTSVEILPIHCKRDSHSNSGHDTYQVNFNLEKPGEYKMVMFWNKKNIPNGSLCLSAIPSLPEPSFSGGIVSEGFVGQAIHVIIDDAERLIDVLDCRCVDALDISVKTVFEPTSKMEGSCVLTITPSSPGMHRVDVNLKSEPICGSPIFFNVSYPINSKKVKVFGPGIVSGLIDSDKGKIYVQTDKAGSGLLQMAIQGPKNGFKLALSGSELQEIDDSPVMTVDYQPQVPGFYKVNILWSGEHVPDSPFHVYNCQDQRQLQELAAGRVPVMHSNSFTNMQQTFTC